MDVHGDRVTRSPTGSPTITLDRPDRLNAFTTNMQREMLRRPRRGRRRSRRAAVVVTGRGRGFCAGADLGGGGATFDAGTNVDAGAVALEADGRHRDEGGLVTLRLFAMTKPVIAAVNGRPSASA